MRKLTKDEVRRAVRCCREGTCLDCPLLEELCDELTVTMDSLPVELLDMIEEILNEES